MTWGVVYIAYGGEWRKRVTASIASLREHHPGATVTVISDQDIIGTDDVRYHARSGLTHVQASRWAKVNLDAVALPQYTLYLDADTEVRGDLSPYIAPLRAGFELVITPSINQGAQILRHLPTVERNVTLTEVGDAVQLQAGVFAFAHTPGMRRLFAAWREEWDRWQGADQGALMRAYQRSPVRLWLLGRDFNGGSVVRHRSAGG